MSQRVLNGLMDGQRHQPPLIIRQTARLLWGMLLWGSSFGLGVACAVQGGPSNAYDPKGRRDPFTPLARDGRLVSGASGTARMAGVSSLVLSGIVWDQGGQSIALVNDTEVRVGETIGDYDVEAIRQDAVVLRHRGQVVLLQLPDEVPSSELPPERSRGGERP